MVHYLKSHKEATVGEIASHVKLSFSATSRHLSILYNADLVEREQRGLEIYYCLSKLLSKVHRRVISIC